MFNPQYFKIGDEWLGAEDYATEALCWAAQAGIAPGDIVMLGKGNIGYRSTIAGAHTYDTYIYTDGVIYDGTLATRSQLAYATALIITADNVFVTNLKLYNNNAYRFAFDPSGNNTYAQYCYIEDVSTSTTYGAVSLYSAATGAVRNCDIKVTCTQAFKIGYDKSATIVSNTVFGATGTALSNTPNSANQTTTDNFFFNNGTDYGNKPASFSNNASQDLTGNETGYDSSHCVDFAGGDYRVKLTSPLHALGIGAFFETAAGTNQNISTVSSQQLTQSQLAVVDYSQATNVIVAQSFNESLLTNVFESSNALVINTEQQAQCLISAIATINSLATVTSEQITQHSSALLNDNQLLTTVQAQQLTDSIAINITSDGVQGVDVVVTEQLSNAVIVSVNEISGIQVTVVQTEQLNQISTTDINLTELVNIVIAEQLINFNTQKINVDLTISPLVAQQYSQSELITIVIANIANQLNIDIDQISLEILTPRYSIEMLTPTYTIEHIH